MKIFKHLLFLTSLFVSVSVQAQTLHVVVFCDTNDKSIGENKESERKITMNEMQTVACCLEEFGYDSEFTECYGNNCSKSNLMSVINNLSIGPDDVVFFYYGGHGTRAENNDNDKFPQMCLGEEYQDNYVPTTLVKNLIMKKNPRLAVILTACCNKEQNGITVKSVVAESESYTKEAELDKEALKELFLGSTGTVVMTSSKAGQYSYSGKEGGIFCLTFWIVMEYVSKGDLMPDWNVICETIKQNVAQIPINTKAGVAYQEPYYEITPGNGSAQAVNTNRRTLRTTNVNNSQSSLANDLSRLLDKTLSIDNRLKMVPDILSRHFSGGAKVCTLGRDMNTVVDYEDAEVFLRRIAMSPFIKQINIVEENGGQNAVLTVHELRTR